MRDQEQFLDVLDRDEAERRFQAAIDVTPRGIEHVSLDAALGRVLAVDVVSTVDVPSFDRSNVDGFAVVSDSTYGASEEQPRVVRLTDEIIHTGVVPSAAVRSGEAVAIATGAMMPRGADAVVMIEHADVRGDELRIARAVTPGSGVAFAGTDITTGETVLRRGQLLTSRDTAVRRPGRSALAASIACSEPSTTTRPRAATAAIASANWWMSAAVVDRISSRMRSRASSVSPIR